MDLHDTLGQRLYLTAAERAARAGYTVEHSVQVAGGTLARVYRVYFPDGRARTPRA